MVKVTVVLCYNVVREHTQIGEQISIAKMKLSHERICPHVTVLLLQLKELDQ
jgi:hypothetical protein